MQAAKAWSMKRRGFREMQSPKFCCWPPGAQGKRMRRFSPGLREMPLSRRELPEGPLPRAGRGGGGMA